mmetsp:Transcript_69859/g.116028  ORF Transcript_69859/g.116028 Transcript_69859/m.116028 type:complete len:272 (-) Transcript_69859:340-1155(-)
MAKGTATACLLRSWDIRTRGNGWTMSCHTAHSRASGTGVTKESLEISAAMALVVARVLMTKNTRVNGWTIIGMGMGCTRRDLRNMKDSLWQVSGRATGDGSRQMEIDMRASFMLISSTGTAHMPQSRAVACTMVSGSKASSTAKALTQVARPCGMRGSGLEESDMAMAWSTTLTEVGTKVSGRTTSRRGKVCGSPMEASATRGSTIAAFVTAKALGLDFTVIRIGELSTGAAWAAQGTFNGRVARSFLAAGLMTPRSSTSTVAVKCLTRCC